MTQEVLNCFFLNEFQKTFPEIRCQLKNNTDGSLDLIVNSPTERLTVILSTENLELSIYFEDSTKLSEWHSHMSLYGTKDQFHEVKVLLELLAKILYTEKCIMFNEVEGYFLSGGLNPEQERNNKENKVRLYSWLEL
jgi:hypothetical protein